MRHFVFLLPLVALLGACVGSSQAPAADSGTPLLNSLQQEVYNHWLDFNRDFVAKDSGIACDPLNWDELSESAGESRVVYELALIDACHEAGELPGFLEWSDYYADAISPSPE